MRHIWDWQVTQGGFAVASTPIVGTKGRERREGKIGTMSAVVKAASDEDVFIQLAGGEGRQAHLAVQGKSQLDRYLNNRLHTSTSKAIKTKSFQLSV